MNIIVITFAVTLLSIFKFQNTNASNTVSLRVYVNEGNAPGEVVADMSEIFGLLWKDRLDRHFKLLNQKIVSSSSFNLPTSLQQRPHAVALGASNGLMTLRRVVDREVECGQAKECIIKVQAVMLPQRVFSLLNLDIVINDINDNLPKFPHKPIVLNVSESTALAEPVNLDAFQARDLDSGNNSRISYSISPSKPFEVQQGVDEAGRPHLQLLLNAELDYETKSVYHLTLHATDHGKPALSNQVTVRIMVTDSNDHSPVFSTSSELVIELLENQEPGIIQTVHATDRDSGENGRVRYFLGDEPQSVSHQLVTVDENSGEVTLVRNLDREVHDGMRILIEARDSPATNQRTTRMWLVLRVDDDNDNAPVINMNFIVDADGQTAYISEASPVGTYVAYVSATDADHGKNSEVEISIKTLINGNFVSSGHFELAADGLIGTGLELDREVQSIYKVAVIACDAGDKIRCSRNNITVIILDENDHTPVFKKSVYEVTLSEADGIGTSVITVSASDMDSKFAPVWTKNENKQLEISLNGKVTYLIESSDNTFSVDATTGEVTLVRPLDREGQSEWEVRVIARDGGNPYRESFCTLKVTVSDVNDNRPLFIYPAVENSTAHATILRDDVIARIQAIDYDSEKFSKVELSMVSVDGCTNLQGVDGNLPYTYFILDTKTGDLRLNMSTTDLNDVVGTHRIIVKASDNGTPPLEMNTSLIIVVSDTLLLPSQMYHEKEDAPSVPGLAISTNFLIIVISLASATLILLIVITAVVIKCKKDNKKIRTYNCRDAESENGWEEGNTDKAQTVNNSNTNTWSKSVVSHEGSSQITENERLSTQSTENNNKQAKGASNRKPSDISLNFPLHVSSGPMLMTSRQDPATYNVTSSMIRPPSLLTTFSTEGKIAQPRLHGLLPHITSHTDGDSGRGDSDPDTGSYDVVKDIDYLPSYSYVNPDSQSKNMKAVVSNGMGSRCTDDCNKYGHSDACWMPSPTKGQYYASADNEVSRSSCYTQPTFTQANSDIDFQREYNRVLETIEETTPVLESTIGYEYEPEVMRQNVRRSICLSRLASESRLLSQSSEPEVYHSGVLSRQYGLWTDEYQKPIGVRPNSLSASPAPSTGPASSHLSGNSSCPSTVFTHCDTDSKTSSNIVAPKPHYLSMTSRASTLPCENNPNMKETQQIISDIDQLLSE
uniref:Cadherin domain-containing protein n=1 Tax=Ciona intestinalis TaxID=7719 RepID=F6URN5_CIOIN